MMDSRGLGIQISHHTVVFRDAPFLNVWKKPCMAKVYVFIQISIELRPSADPGAIVIKSWVDLSRNKSSTCKQLKQKKQTEVATRASMAIGISNTLGCASVRLDLNRLWYLLASEPPRLFAKNTSRSTAMTAGWANGLDLTILRAWSCVPYGNDGVEASKWCKRSVRLTCFVG